MILFIQLGDMIQNLKANLTTFLKMTTDPFYFQQLYFSNKKLDETKILV